MVVAPYQARYDPSLFRGHQAPARDPKGTFDARGAEQERRIATRDHGQADEEDLRQAGEEGAGASATKLCRPAAKATTKPSKAAPAKKATKATKPAKKVLKPAPVTKAVRPTKALAKATSKPASRAPAKTPVAKATA